MKISSTESDASVLRELGDRLAAARLARNLTQQGLAGEAGVSKRTVERVESGEVAAQLSAFIRICRALGLLERLDALVPEPAQSPMAQLKLRGKQRRRAAGSRAGAVVTPPAWAWRDQS